MFKQHTKSLMALALVVGTGLGGQLAQAASVSATASIMGRTGTLLTFSNDQYLSDASTPFQSGFDAGSVLQNYNFNSSTVAGSSFAGIDNSFAPLPQTAAGAVTRGQGSATVLWTFDWVATGTGTAQLDLDYLYNATVMNWGAGETGIASAYIGAFLDGSTTTQQEALYFFTNQNQDISGFNNLFLNFAVNAGDTGTFTVTVASNALASPVPAPAALWLMSSSLIGLLGLHRKSA